MDRTLTQYGAVEPGLFDGIEKGVTEAEPAIDKLKKLGKGYKDAAVGFVKKHPIASTGAGGFLVGRHLMKAQLRAKMAENNPYGYNTIEKITKFIKARPAMSAGVGGFLAGGDFEVHRLGRKIRAKRAELIQQTQQNPYIPAQYDIIGPIAELSTTAAKGIGPILGKATSSIVQHPFLTAGAVTAGKIAQKHADQQQGYSIFYDENEDRGHEHFDETIDKLMHHPAVVEYLKRKFSQTREKIKQAESRLFPEHND